jgi:hypothetical protein
VVRRSKYFEYGIVIEEDRKNNIVKGWNSTLNKILNNPQSTFVDLYYCLKKETDNSDILYECNYLNIEGKRRKKRKSNLFR